jgi:STE24 endopeptidase
MHPYAIVVLVAIVGEWLLGILADTLNVRSSRAGVPAELRTVLDAETHRRSQAYARARTRLGMAAETVNLTALLLFWRLDGFVRLDRWLGTFSLGPIGTGLAFIGALALGRTALALPARLYGTFVIESRFGFNRTRPATFCADLVKGLALAVALGTSMLAAVLYFFEHTGPEAWLYCWAAMTVMLVAVELAVPTWILPLFNRFTPLRGGELHDRIVAYTGAVGFPVQGIFVIDGSRRTTKANAFFAGIGKTRRIALFDTLVATHPVSEIVAVVAHEVGHYKLGHVPRRLLAGIAHAGAVFALLSFFLHQDGLYAAFGMTQRALYAGLVFFALLYTPIDLVLSLVLHAVSRRHEREADRFAARTTGEPRALAAALQRLAVEQLSNVTPHPLHVALRFSHPPVVERVRALCREATGEARGQTTEKATTRPG